ncbi:uncharacterized protein LOC143031142 [Oratosquilla oratoria]|uniref:uncharacterized protein LOC143030914 n=1 Tax=Oratosquilla oratoria TaxID=337810 RepID=UPI003F774A47
MLPHHDWYATSASFTLHSPQEAQEGKRPTLPEQVVCTVSVGDIMEEILEDADDPPRSPSPAMVPTPSPASSTSSHSSAYYGPPRKRTKVNDPVDQKIVDTCSAINEILGNEPPKSTLVKHTVSTIASYLSVLKDERQRDVAAKLLNVIHNEPQLSPNDLALN